VFGSRAVDWTAGPNFVENVSLLRDAEVPESHPRSHCHLPALLRRVLQSPHPRQHNLHGPRQSELTQPLLARFPGACVGGSHPQTGGAFREVPKKQKSAIRSEVRFGDLRLLRTLLSGLRRVRLLGPQFEVLLCRSALFHRHRSGLLVLIVDGSLRFSFKYLHKMVWLLQKTILPL